METDKKENRGGAGRGQGAKSREEKGLPPTRTFTSRAEITVIDMCIEKFGSIAEALRYAAKAKKSTKK